MSKRKNILVTGGAGYIGSHMVRTFLEEGVYRPLVFDNLSTGHKKLVPKGVVFIKGDLRKENDIRAAFKKCPIDAVVHFAASIVVPESVAYPEKYYENNVSATINLLKVMLDHRVRTMIFSSTAAVYGEPKRIPVTEADETVPTSPYGESKLMVEKILSAVAKSHDLSYAALRYFNVCGAHPAGDLGSLKKEETLLIPNILKAARNPKFTLNVFGNDYPTRDGTCIRDYIHVVDICEAHLLALKKLGQGMKSGVFNLGNEQGHTVKEVVGAVEKITGKKIRVHIAPRRPGDPARVVASSKKAKKVLGWVPRLGLDRIVETAWRWENRGGGNR